MSIRQTTTLTALAVLACAPLAPVRAQGPSESPAQQGQPADPAARPAGVPADDRPVLLENIDVDSQTGAPRRNPPSFERQEQRFLRRPGAETVKSVTNMDPGPREAVKEALRDVPGVYVAPRGLGSQGQISIRGSDIGQTGPRAGRGVRAYIDGVPLGRTESGITNALLDLYATDYLEIYRGPNSLRYGAIVTGGAINAISKTGLTSPGLVANAAGGMFGFAEGQVQYGYAGENFDVYGQANIFNLDGFQVNNGEQNIKGSANFGYRFENGTENRTYVGIGKTRQKLAGAIPLNSIWQQRRWPTYDSVRINYRADFDFYRVANRTIFQSGSTSFEVTPYFLYTQFDHLPVAQSGIVDNIWRDVGLATRVEHKSSLLGMPMELVGGARGNFENGTFERWQWRNAGWDHGQNVANWNFNSWLLEAFGEVSVEFLPRVRLFLGLQAFSTTRDLQDNYKGPNVIPAIPFGLNPQPGRAAGRQEYARLFQELNPKLGVNWEYSKNQFFFATVARAYEVPTGADLSNVLSVQAQTGVIQPLLQGQSAWTQEFGFRGGWERFNYDVTFYNQNISNEILTKCATVVSPTLCTTQNQVAFNASNTIHQGIELGLKTVPLVDLFTPRDQLYWNTTYNLNNFFFNNDPLFGSNYLPLIPQNQLFTEVGYRHPSGAYFGVNFQYLSQRTTTFDGSGGLAFIVPPLALLGLKAGYRPEDKPFAVWVEARNLTDNAFAGDFSASATAVGATPLVNPGDGRWVGAGLTVKF